MATQYVELQPEGASFLATAFGPFLVNLGTNAPVPVLAHAVDVDSSGFWHLNAINYGAGNLTLDIYWYADTATSGDVIWTGAIAAITPNTDTTDIETKAFATAGTVTDTHLGTTGQRLHQCTITISNLDSLAARDHVMLRISRNGANGSDTMAGTAYLAGAVLSYSDT